MVARSASCNTTRQMASFACTGPAGRALVKRVILLEVFAVLCWPLAAVCYSGTQLEVLQNETFGLPPLSVFPHFPDYHVIYSKRRSIGSHPQSCREAGRDHGADVYAVTPRQV